MTFDYDTFCKRVKDLRKINGMNKFQMSIQSNIQYQYYCDIENGKNAPNFKNVIFIANALKTDLGTLLKENDNSLMNTLKSDTISSLKQIQNDEILMKCNEIFLLFQEKMRNEVIND